MKNLREILARASRDKVLRLTELRVLNHVISISEDGVTFHIGNIRHMAGHLGMDYNRQRPQISRALKRLQKLGYFSSEALGDFRFCAADSSMRTPGVTPPPDNGAEMYDVGLTYDPPCDSGVTRPAAQDLADDTVDAETSYPGIVCDPLSTSTSRVTSADPMISDPPVAEEAPPECFGSFNVSDPRCLDCHEQDECEEVRENEYAQSPQGDSPDCMIDGYDESSETCHKCARRIECVEEYYGLRHADSHDGE